MRVCKQEAVYYNRTGRFKPEMDMKVVHEDVCLDVQPMEIMKLVAALSIPITGGLMKTLCRVWCCPDDHPLNTNSGGTRFAMRVVRNPPEHCESCGDKLAYKEYTVKNGTPLHGWGYIAEYDMWVCTSEHHHFTERGRLDPEGSWRAMIKANDCSQLD